MGLGEQWLGLTEGYATLYPSVCSSGFWSEVTVWLDGSKISMVGLPGPVALNRPPLTITLLLGRPSCQYMERVGWGGR